MVRKQTKNEPAERQRGTITKNGHDDIWLVRVFTGSKLVDGKREHKYVSKIIRGTYRQADQERTKMLGDMDKETLPHLSRRSVTTWRTGWRHQ
jgi:hypothetical protein